MHESLKPSSPLVSTSDERLANHKGALPQMEQEGRERHLFGQACIKLALNVFFEPFHMVLFFFNVYIGFVVAKTEHERN